MSALHDMEDWYSVYNYFWLNKAIQIHLPLDFVTDEYLRTTKVHNLYRTTLYDITNFYKLNEAFYFNQAIKSTNWNTYELFYDDDLYLNDKQINCYPWNNGGVYNFEMFLPKQPIQYSFFDQQGKLLTREPFYRKPDELSLIGKINETCLTIILVSSLATITIRFGMTVVYLIENF
jgi:hypothetical protein